MNLKIQFVSLAATGRYSVTQLCEGFDISRKIGHKWLRRYTEQGPLIGPDNNEHGSLQEGEPNSAKKTIQRRV